MLNLAAKGGSPVVALGIVLVDVRIMIGGSIKEGMNE